MTLAQLRTTTLRTLEEANKLLQAIDLVQLHMQETQSTEEPLDYSAHIVRVFGSYVDDLRKRGITVVKYLDARDTIEKVIGKPIRELEAVITKSIQKRLRVHIGFNNVEILK